MVTIMRCDGNLFSKEITKSAIFKRLEFMSCYQYRVACSFPEFHILEIIFWNKTCADKNSENSQENVRGGIHFRL